MSYMRDSAGRRLDERPSADLKRPNTIALLGDSITWYNGPGGLYDPTVTVPYQSGYGYFTWANIALNGRLKLLRQAGVGGERSDQILARIDDILDLPELPGYCFIMAGSNDMLQDVPAATTIANLTEIHDTLIAAGITVVAGVMPYIWSATSSRLLAQATVNDWIRTQADKPGIIICDWAAKWASPFGDGTPATGYSYDGVHPTLVGAAVLGGVLAEALRPHVGSIPVGLATTNIEPTNVLANGLMLGTTGVLNTGTTGQLATSWNAGRTAGAGTLTCAKASRSDGYPGAWQTLTLSGTSSTYVVWQDASPAGIAAGQQWEAECEFEALTPTDIHKFTLTLACLGAGANAGGIALAESAGQAYVYPSSIPAGVMRTPAVTLIGSVTGLRISIDLVGTAGSVKVSRVRARRVA